MTSLFQARRRAEEFAAAVDGQAPGRQAGGQEVTTLLALVGALRDQAAAEPRAEFASDLRSRLMLEAETALRPETANLLLPVRERGRRERRLVAAASAFVLIGGTTTMAAAAQSSLPGDALYPIKRGIEGVEAGLSMSDAGKGKDLLNQASDRLLEVEGLIGASAFQDEPRVPATLADFSDSATEGSTLLFESFRETADPEAIVTVRSFAAEGIATLEALAAEVPDEAQDELAAAATLLSEIDAEAAGLCSTCAPDLPAVEVPGIFLARAEVDRALALAAGTVLDNNHPVVVRRPAAPATPGPADVTPAPEAPTTDGPTADAPAAPEPTPLPSPDWQPESWPSLLPGLEGETTTKEDGSGGTVADELNANLTDVVETLLPDTDGTLP